ncbi:MAG TPA: serine/threonine-protein kinase [Gemmatimonadales bacterium]|nr:serine/threonine-protein kinase [Gemmatimonadales bacterium]
MSDPLLQKFQHLLEGRYSIDRELGRGGMSTVYLATDLRHGRTVAIKLLQPEITTSLTAERFLREIQITAKLQHPNILGLFDSGAENGLCYYVMPHVEGETLRDRLVWEKQLPLDRALQIGIEVASALAYAHTRGVVHRDIKPENILFSAGHAMVADFGIARAVSEGQRSITAIGIPLGTPPYMSPEQAQGLENIDHRSDIYALGCMLFEMVAGRPPFMGTSIGRVIQAHLTEPPPHLRSFRPDAPESLQAVIERCLAKNPDDRFQKVDDVVQALQLISAASTLERATPDQMSRIGTPIPPPAAPGPTVEEPHDTGRRFLIIAAAVGVVALLLAGWFLLRPKGGAGAAEPAIAVLPPDVVAGDPGMAALGRGIAQEVEGALRGIEGLGIKSAASVSALQSRGLTLAQIADSLRLTLLVVGSVQSDRRTARIGMQLVDAQADNVVWSETWDASVDSLLAVQRTVGSSVAAAVRGRLEPR